MSASAGDNRSPREIEADLERNRDRIGDRIDRLESRLSPGELFDQAWRYASKKRADGTTSRLQDAVVNNPLPVTLIGLGLAWMALSGSEGSVAREPRKPASDKPLAERADRSSTSVSTAPSATATSHPTPAATPTAGTPPPAPSARSTPPPPSPATKPKW